jgi:hypothetical protein
MAAWTLYGAQRFVTKSCDWLAGCDQELIDGWLLADPDPELVQLF